MTSSGVSAARRAWQAVRSDVRTRSEAWLVGIWLTWRRRSAPSGWDSPDDYSPDYFVGVTSRCGRRNVERGALPPHAPTTPPACDSPRARSHNNGEGHPQNREPSLLEHKNSKRESSHIWTVRSSRQRLEESLVTLSIPPFKIAY